ncbi:MAG TPA: hypothetical protein VNE62_07965 [Actinomycetota bacterium]|nr:hypothetical protein [Actinomycetota bacterium]
MLTILFVTVLAILLALPLIPIARSERTLTWTSAILLATLIGIVVTLFIAEIPSRMLYWFDSEHTKIGEKYTFLGFMKGDGYMYVRDIVVNTVQGIFFFVMCALTYVWGQRQRRAGRFKS